MKIVLALLVLVWPATASGDALPLQRGSWSQLLQAHQGHALIVHFWGVTCGPCLAELPEWGKFHARRPEIDLVLVQADPDADLPSEPAMLLAKAGLGDVESWRFADPFVERLQYEIDPQWHGELPLTLLISRDGASMSSFGVINFDDLVDWLAKHS